MRINHGYQDFPKLSKITSKNVQCPFCQTPHNKGDEAVFLEFNGGPTGKTYLCQNHARELAQNILQITGNWPNHCV